MRPLILAALILAGCSQPTHVTTVHADSFYTDTMTQMNRGDYDGAEYKAQRVIRDPASTKQLCEAYKVMGFVARHRDQYEAAAVYYTSLIETCPDAKAGAYLNRAECKAEVAKGAYLEKRLRLVREAESDLAEAVRLDPALKAKADTVRADLPRSP